MAKFKPGQCGNPSGRKKGTPNKSTEQLRALVQAFIELNWQRVQKDFDAMKPGERLAFLNSLLRHVLPEPMTFEKLSEDQLKQLHEYLLKKYTNEQTIKN
jgi:hypothetical protein